MPSFQVTTPTSEQNAKSIASALMQIWLWFVFSHTIVIGKDSRLHEVFAETAELLHIDIHILSAENHDPMLVEHVYHILNFSLAMFFLTSTVLLKVAQETVLLSIYTWNSAHIPGTDISCSLVVIGWDFYLSIDFSDNKHMSLTPLPGQVAAFSLNKPIS